MVKIRFLLLLFFFGNSSKAQLIDSLHLMNDLKELSSDLYQGRKPGTYGGRVAQYYLSTRFKEIGLEAFKPDYKLPFVIYEKINPALPDADTINYKKLLGVNIAGFIKGKDSTTIVISAHFDHVGKIGNDIYNGADDNASGTSAVIAIAEYFIKHPPQHTLVFVAFDAEELGMKGSSAFVFNPPVNMDSVLLNINLDMIGTSTNDELYVSGTRQFPKFRDAIRKVRSKDRSQVHLEFGYDDPNDINNRLVRSDHAAFYVFFKKPFLYFGVPEHKNYHKPTDDYENISHSFYYHGVEMILKITEEIDKNFPGIISK